MVGEKSSKSVFSTKNQHSLANVKMHKYNICPECGSEKIIKFGSRKNNNDIIVQKYKCNRCHKIFSIKPKVNKIDLIPHWAKLAYTEYIKYKLKINYIVAKYHKNYRTVMKNFKLIKIEYKKQGISPIIPPSQKLDQVLSSLPQQHSVILSLDGTFFK